MPIVAHSRVEGAPRFQRGGALVGEHVIYVEREADAQLLDSLRAGEYCLVFASRQVGKSSLRQRVARQLRREGVHTAYVDLSAIGSGTTAEAWFYSVINEIAASLGKRDIVPGFWKNFPTYQSAPIYFQSFIRHLMLEQTDAPLVIFVDEVDITLSLTGWRDDFFSSIRAMFTSRGDEELWRRVTFCLIGVMTRDDLAQSSGRTPFNVQCTEIDLRDLTRQDLEHFRRGFASLSANHTVLLDAIYYWTRGHPALSQRLCAALVEQGVKPGEEASTVKRLVEELFLKHGRELDPVLNDTSRRFRGRDVDPLMPRMLEVYTRMLRGHVIDADARALRADELQIFARLTVAGLARTSHGKLRLRNRIVENVFNYSWVRSVGADRFLAHELRRWIDGGKLSTDLLRGARLRQASEWARSKPDLTKAERDFLFQSERQASRQKITRLVGVMSTVALFVISILSYRLYRQINDEVAVPRLLKPMKAMTGILTEREKHARMSGLATETASRAALITANVPGHEIDAINFALRAMTNFDGQIPTIELERQALPGQATDALLHALENSLAPGHVLAHGSAVTDVSYSYDGKYLVTTSADRHTRVWQTKSGARLRDYRPVERPQPDKEDTAEKRKAIEAMRKATCDRGGGMARFFGRNKFAASYPSGAKVASVDYGRASVDQNHIPATFGCFLDVGGGDVFSFCGQGDTVGICVSRTTDGKVPNFIASPAKLSPKEFRVHPDGEMLAVTYTNGSTNLLSLRKASNGDVWVSEVQSVCQHPKNDHTMLAFSSDGSRLAIGHGDGEVRIFDTERPEWAAARLRGHTEAIESIHFASDDAERLISRDSEDNVHVWNIRTRSMISPFAEGGVRGDLVEVSASGDRVAVASGARIRVWVSGASGYENGCELEGHQGDVTAMEFSPHEIGLASASEDGTARLWRLDKSQPTERIPNVWPSVSRLRYGHVVKRPSTDQLLSVSASFDKSPRDYFVPWPGSDTVATLDDRGVLEVWRSGHGSARRVKKMLVDPGPGEQPEKAARKVAFSPDGHQLAATSRRTGVGREAAGGTDGTVEFLVSAWDTNRPGPSGGSPLLYRERLSAEPVSLTVSEPVVVRGAESYFTAVAEKGGNVEIFSPRGRVVHTIEGMQDVVHLAFSKSANESLVLTVVTDDQVTLWQLCEGRLGFEKRRDRALGDETFMGHADGRPVIMLANFSEMKVIDLEVADDEPVFVAEGQFSAGAVSPNLEYLVTLAVDHETLSLWGVEAGPESEHGEAIARWRPSDGKVREFYATNDDHVMVFAEDALTIWSVNPLGWVTQGCRILSFLGGWDWDVKTACLASNLL